MNHRLERVREVIKRELGVILEREITFEASLVTVNNVDITPDLRQCHVYVSVIGSASDKKRVLTKLGGNRVVLQTALAQRVKLKYTPRLNFHLDESIERGTRITEILQELNLVEPELPEPVEKKLNIESNEH